jgi:hypothetical protein
MTRGAAPTQVAFDPSTDALAGELRSPCLTTAIAETGGRSGDAMIAVGMIEDLLLVVALVSALMLMGQ